jgi:hypothetical protein
MIKKYVKFKWKSINKSKIEKNKDSVATTPALKIPNFSKYFFFYKFPSDYSLVTMNTQKYQQGNEYPIRFMSIGLRGIEMIYPAVDKQAFFVHKAIN